MTPPARAPVLVVGEGALAAAVLQALQGEGFPVSAEATLYGAAQRLARPAEARVAVVCQDGAGPVQIDATARLCRGCPQVSVVVCSDADEARERLLEAGAAFHLSPALLEPRLLADVIRSAAERARLHAELERSEATRAQEEARFRNTVQRIADGIVVLNGEGTILFANAAAEDLFGRGSGALVGEELGQPIEVAGPPAVLDILSRDGEHRLAELRVGATVWEGRAAHLVSLRDVTERTRMEDRARHLIREQAARQEAESAAERSEFLARASRDLSTSLDRDAILATLTRLVIDRFGDHCFAEVLEGGDATPRRAFASRPGTARAALLRDLEERACLISRVFMEDLAGDGAARLIEVVTPAWIREVASGSREGRLLTALAPAAALVAPVARGADFKGAVVVLATQGTPPPGRGDAVLLSELAQRAALALENARLYRVAEQAARAKSDFLAVVSHELRTPLSGVLGYAGLLREEVAGPLAAMQRSYVDGVSRCSHQLLKLVDQILLFASSEAELERVHPEPVDVRALVDDVASVARPLAEREGLEFRVRAPRRHFTVVTDAGMIRQILLHLLTNAVKYTPEGHVALETRVEGRELILRVRDTGTGIPRDQLAQIFESFRQVEPPHTRTSGGAGLGLATVQNLTHLLGGWVDVRSRVGRGSTFTVRLPAQGGRDEASGRSPAAPSSKETPPPPAPRTRAPRARAPRRPRTPPGPSPHPQV